MKCVCATCGTNVANDTDGYCINDHDDWLEFRDFDIPEHRYVVERAMKNFNLTEGDILQAMIEGKCLSKKDKLILNMYSGTIEVQENPNNIDIEIRDYDIDGVEEERLLKDSFGKEYIIYIL